MFKKILIANRGEIALRIIKTCKEMGIKTVTIHSEADVNLLHVKNADETYPLEGNLVKETYLDIEKIIDIAKKSEVDAIHPGYGFLSENEEFVKRCESEEIVFIGPQAEIIAKMGDKIESRNIMKKAGVPIIPGHKGSLKTIFEAEIAAEKMGYPVMLKASAGGGGIGMQIINNKKELKKVFESNKRRAKDFFGNEAMYLEKYITNPRHIEVQILADKYGNVVHLGERECSIQRRHQKVIEEAPAKFIDSKTLEDMRDAAIQATKSIGYFNAGTIEFLVDDESNFYFLEMNTRLQVEHPVTEEVTGLDLVREQIRIAFGEKVKSTQSDIEVKGHAIEARIYAEDSKTFFPSPGKITKLRLPKFEGIRHEIAIEEGAEISPYYDPMIAKIVVYKNNREAAMRMLVKGLQEYEIQGIKTNIPLLIKILNNSEFVKGNISTNFIKDYFN